MYQDINQTLRRGNRCLAARMEMIQNHIASVNIGDIEVEGTPDHKVAMDIYVRWDKVEDTGISWTDFVSTLPGDITSHPAFVASLRSAWQAKSVQLKSIKIWGGGKQKEYPREFFIPEMQKITQIL